MENRSLEITVVSAKGLKKVKHLSKMDVYVTVKLSGDPTYSGQRELRTPVARDGGTNPRWTDTSLTFTVSEALAQANRLLITFKIMCERGARGDQDIGEAHVPLKELLDHLGSDKTGQRYVSYMVKKPNGKPRGEINFTYKFSGHLARSGGGGGFAVHAPPPNPSVYPIQNRPALAQLLPSWGPLGHDACSPYTNYTTVAPPTIYPPAGYPTVSPPYIPPAGYLAEGPPAGYPYPAPQTPPDVYPPMGGYKF